MSGKRRSYESGHRPKFMVVVDETPECERAIRFAARRAARLGASMLMVAVTEPPESFEWLGVGDAMRAEAEEEATARLDAAAATARAAAGVEPERIVRLGDPATEILEVIREENGGAADRAVCVRAMPDTASYASPAAPVHALARAVTGGDPPKS